ncbi:MAG: hypothetical protein GEU73_00355 [Chloroflexi bacterium]|nr:hypothetical protein [Chloroflexota bacterium]
MKAAPRRPLPQVSDIETKPFWEGCARGEILLQRCLDCSAVRHPPSPICSGCLSSRLEWVPASGNATVYSFVVVHRAFHAAFEEDVPYVVAIVELEEGPHMLSNVVEVPPESVEIGMPLRVCFDCVSDEVTLPKFKPA